jgi:plasmid maintenance system antidote protein VapI
MKSAEILRDVLEQKLKANSSYSSRAFARDLGVSPTYVSFLLNGKKKLTIKRALSVSQILKMTESQARVFLKSVVLESRLNSEDIFEELFNRKTD